MCIYTCIPTSRSHVHYKVHSQNFVNIQTMNMQTGNMQTCREHADREHADREHADREHADGMFGLHSQIRTQAYLSINGKSEANTAIILICRHYLNVNELIESQQDSGLQAWTMYNVPFHTAPCVVHLALEQNCQG